MNTKINYSYEDLVKVKGSVIVRGHTEDFTRVYGLCKGLELFDARAVGLPDLSKKALASRNRAPNRWHKIESIEYTEEDATLDASSAEVMARFEEQHEAAWPEPDANIRSLFRAMTS